MKFARKFTSQSKVIAVMIAIFLTAGIAGAQVMEQIPDDALIVMKVKNVNATSQKIGKFLNDLGLAAMIPGADNPMGMMQQHLGVTQGLRTDGDFAVAYRDPAKTTESPDQSIVMLIPVSDYAAFVANFGGAKADGKITQVQLPEGHDGFIAQWGTFAALSASRKAVETPVAGVLKIAGEATNRELASHDVSIYVNMVGMRPKAQAHMGQIRQQSMEQVEAGMPKDEKMAKFGPLVKAVTNQFFNAADAFVRDADAVTVSMNFVDDGINGAAMAEFEGKSYLGTTFASLKNTDQFMLKGLPAGKYLMYGGQVNQPEVCTRLLADFAAPILKELDAVGPEMKPAHDYMDSLMAFVKANTSSASGVVAPSGMLGQEAIFQLLTVAQGDAPAMKQAQIKMAQNQAEVMKALGMPADAYTMTITPKAKTIDGVTFDSITTAVNGNANDPAARQQQQIMAMIYGPGGMNMLEGEIGANQLLVAMGVSDEVLTSTIATAKSGGAPLADSAGVKAVAAHLPAKRLIEYYLPIDQIATTGLGYLKTFGAGVNVTLPADLAPIGMSVSSEGSAVRMDGYVPTELIKQLVSAGLQVYQQMQGGRGPGGPPPANNNPGGDGK